MPRPNLTNANLPSHCGTCVHLQWEEDICICRHPEFITDKEILDGIEFWEDENDVVRLAENIYNDYIDDCCDWHDYFLVCECYEKSYADGDPERKAFQRFCRRVERLWSQNK